MKSFILQHLPQHGPQAKEEEKVVVVQCMGPGPRGGCGWAARWAGFAAMAETDGLLDALGGGRGGAAGNLAGRLQVLRQRMGRRKLLSEVLADPDAGDTDGAGPSAYGEPADEEGVEVGLSKSLGIWDVIAYGVGGTIGAGLFVVTGKAAKLAGPAVGLSFLLASLSCLMSAFCYAEFATRVPVAGSAYSFTYVTLGEGMAWYIGWNLTLEYGIAASAIARGWAGYCHYFLENVGVPVPRWLYDVPIAAGRGVTFHGSPLALVILAACTLVLLPGAKASSRLNVVMTACNLVLILFIVVAGASAVNRDNWHPFAPHGMQGIAAGAGFVFFSYVGFDTVCTLAEELENPQRDLPRAILGSLGIVTALYVVVCLVLTGMEPIEQMDIKSPLATAFSDAGMGWAGTVVALGTTTTLASTTLCSLFGQPRIFYRMAKDGLLMKRFASVHPKTQVPVFGTLVSSAVASVLAFFLDIDALSDMVSIGTLMAFCVVCLGILVLRYPNQAGGGVSTAATQVALKIELPVALGKVASPGLFIKAFVLCSAACCAGISYELPAPVPALSGVGCLLCALALAVLPQQVPVAAVPDRPIFACPMVPLVPCAGAFINIYMMFSLSVEALLRLVAWTALGFVIYSAYGIKHSALNKRDPK